MIHYKNEDQAAHYIAQNAADGALHRLLGANFRGQLVPPEGTARKVGKGVAGKTEDERQQQVGPVDAGGLQPNSAAII